ncbi:hypothetical protein ACQKQD_18425 [Methylobacterium sp. NPDC080182]|uniref:hypothetical protein n=1 Tax=Methylobacterium sp. NPDC080182 TaxID=3390590 RepID=UPI003CFC63D6
MNARLRRLETAIRPPRHRTVRRFAIEGPKNLPEGAAEAFLRECGHDLKDEDLNIIRVVIAPGPDLALRDVTAEVCR